MYEIINNLIAIPPENHIAFNSRPNRNKHNQQIKVKSVNVDAYKYSFFPKTIVDWNTLKQEEVDCRSVEQFKAVLQKSN